VAERNYKYLTHDTDRHGNERLYFRKRGQQRIRIRHEPGTPEFEALHVMFVRGELQPAKRPSLGRGAYVYCIGGRNGPFKVGIARNVERRLRNLQNGNPRKLEIHRAFSVANMVFAREIEAASHEAMAATRRAGEWFATTLENIEASIRTAADALGHAIHGVRL